MSRETINIVWLKRDLRLHDHEPLYRAEQADLPYLILYLFEPSLLDHPDTSLRHLQFVYHSILSVNRSLAPYHRKVDLFYGEARSVFEFLSDQYTVRNVFSYRETGIQLTWDRDKEMVSFFRQKGICWSEFQRDGIQRGIKNRKNWNRNWYVKMREPVFENSFSKP